MYLHLGEKTVIRTDAVTGIFDLDNTTLSHHTRSFLSRAEKEGRVVNVSYELPKSFIVCMEDKEEKIYISQLSSQTIYKRIIALSKGRKK